MRMAIAMAIDKQGIVDKAYDGAPVPRHFADPTSPRTVALRRPRGRADPVRPGRRQRTARRDRLRAAATTASASTRTPETGSSLRMPISQETAGALASGQLIVGYLDQIGIEVEIFPVNEGKMYSYWNDRRLGRVHLVLDRRARPQLPAHHVDDRPVQGAQRRLLEQRRVRRARQGAGDHRRPRGERRRSSTRRWPCRTPRCRRSRSPTRTTSRPTATTWSPTSPPCPATDGYLIPNYNNVGMVTVRPADDDSAAARTRPPDSRPGRGARIIAGRRVGAFLIFRRGSRADEEEG